MPMLAELWLPIVLSAVAVWIASALAWMVMPHHKGEFKALPDEDAFIRAVRDMKIPQGVYGFPDCSDHSKMKDPALIAKFNEGPVGMLHVWPPGMKMGGKMVASFIFNVVVSAFIAYLASMTIESGADFMRVFRVTSVAGIMAYTFASIPQAIWFNTPARNMLACIADGIAFGLITGAIFGWLWPGA